MQDLLLRVGDGERHRGEENKGGGKDENGKGFVEQFRIDGMFEDL